MTVDAWRVWMLGIAIVALLTGGVTAAVLEEVTSDLEWEPRVAPLAAFVAEERGLAFEHPVPVEFLGDDEFSEAMSGDTEALTEADEEEAESFSRLFRAAGLISGDSDLAESSDELVDEGVLALYDPESKRVLVRGTEVTVKVKATLVHELTHALQDQHFDLSRIEELETSGQQLAFRALAEGDADRIEDAYVETLPTSEQDQYEDDSAEIPDLADIPPALISYFSAPYALGDQFVGLLEEAEGESAIDDAFEDPPQSDESLLDPLGYIAGDEPVAVDTPELGPGEEEFDSGDWGALTWLLMLGARIDPHVALHAVDGWGGDAYVAFERDGTTCVRVAYVGDTETDTDEMAAAVDQWVAAMPPGAASTTRLGETVRLDACDPGPGATLTFNPGYADLLVLPVARTDILREFLDQGAPREVARCIGQGIVDSTSIAELVSDESPDEDSPFGRRIQAVVARCAEEG